jgi:multicomponent Na+:H+ antiporter subunit D
LPTGAQLIVGAVLFPIGSALLLALIPERSDRARNTMAIFIAAVTAAMVLMILPEVLQGRIAFISVLTIFPGLELAFRADPLAILFGVIAAVLWVFTVVYSTGYMAHETDRRRYFVFFILSLGTTMGIAFSANLFVLYLFYELLTIFTYPLVIHTGGKKSQVAGKRYIIYSFVGAAFVLAALVMTYTLTGTLDFTPAALFIPPWARRGYGGSSSSALSSASASKRRSCPFTPGFPQPWWRRRPSAPFFTLWPWLSRASSASSG